MDIKKILITFSLGSALALGLLSKPKASEWDTETKALYWSGAALIVADWGQTRVISRNPQSYRELNPWLGEHPSQSKVDAYFLGYLLTHYLIADMMPEPYKGKALAVILAVQFSAVRGNASIGINMRF
jgi:hypothetical protein